MKSSWPSRTTTLPGHFGREVVLGALWCLEEVERLAQDYVFHFLARQVVAQGHERGRALHELLLELGVHGADYALFRGVDGLGVALAGQGGKEGSRLLLPGSPGAVDLVAGLDAGKGDLARVGRLHLDLAVGRLLYLLEQVGYVQHRLSTFHAA